MKIYGKKRKMNFNIPKIDKIYNCFDDGKIKESRLYKVKIKEIVPFDMIDKDTLAEWNKEVKQCDWLYSKITDYFIKTISSDMDEEIFVRTLDNGWFSIGGFINSGRLDVDGSLTKYLENNK